MTTTRHLGFMAVDQSGQTYHIGNNSPRKWLLDYFGKSRATKMYVDCKNGTIKHTGYVINDMWLRIYRISEWKSEKVKV